MKSFAGHFKHMPGKEKAVPVVTKIGRGKGLTLEVYAAAIILRHLVGFFFSSLINCIFFPKLFFQAIRRSLEFFWVFWNFVFTQMIVNALCKANI
jgi:hypothetical protein